MQELYHQTLGCVLQDWHRLWDRWARPLGPMRLGFRSELNRLRGLTGAQAHIAALLQPEHCGSLDLLDPHLVLTWLALRSLVGLQ
jgi:hypothetical protein